MVTKGASQEPCRSAESYLTLGFVPSDSRASEYLDRLFTPGQRDTAAPQLLREILEASTYSKGHREIVIPLTGGNDSRNLLGAALDIFDVKMIRCVTVGVEWFSDCIGAAETCRRVGVSHERIEANRLSWDIDKLLAMARGRFEATGSFVTPETLIAFGEIGDRFGVERPIISGFLGDAVSGKHLPTRNGRLSTQPVEVSFLAANRSILDGSHSPKLREQFRSFVAHNAWRLADFPGGTTYDLLDFGFRQSHYIRPNSDAFAMCVRPFEDPRWVYHWLSRPLTDRIAQCAYLREMRLAFSNVFGTASTRKPRYHQIRQLVPSSVREWVRQKLRPPLLSVAANRGDPRFNESMRKVVEDLLTSFDRRKILSFPTIPALRATMRRFDERSFQIVRWASSAELHIRAGNMTP